MLQVNNEQNNITTTEQKPSNAPPQTPLPNSLATLMQEITKQTNLATQQTDLLRKRHDALSNALKQEEKMANQQTRQSVIIENAITNSLVQTISYSSTGMTPHSK